MYIIKIGYFQNTCEMTIINQILMIICYMKMPTKQLKTAMDSDMKSKTQYVLYTLLMFK